MEKKPLGCEVSVKNRIENAAASYAGEFRRVLKDEGLASVAQIFGDMQNGLGSVAYRVSTLREQVGECVNVNCVFLKAHPGSDAWAVTNSHTDEARSSCTPTT